jgi:hypothetical protein
MTLEAVRLRLFAVPFTAAALTVACGGGQILQSPTAPTSSGATASLTSGGGAAAAVDDAPVVETLAKGGIPGGNGRGGANKPDDSEGEGPGRGGKPEFVGSPGHGHQDRVVGFVTAKNGDTLTVRGISVAAGEDAIIRHGHLILEISDIEVGDHIQARGELDGTTLTASEIKVQDTNHEGKDDDEDDEEDED